VALRLTSRLDEEPSQLRLGEPPQLHVAPSEDPFGRGGSPLLVEIFQNPDQLGLWEI
jgi:hypothetical protein